MAEVSELKVDFDVSSMKSATIAANKLADALQRVSDSLGDLDKHGHGGIVFDSIGEVSHIEIKPSD